jgi:hypothetical protein
MSDGVMPGAVPAVHGAPAAPGGHSAIDVQRLAEKVYALLLADARLGHARTESAAAPRRSAED